MMPEVTNRVEGGTSADRRLPVKYHCLISCTQSLLGVGDATGSAEPSGKVGDFLVSMRPTFFVLEARRSAP